MLSDLNGPSPQFTLTCISTGGPATTVTWTRDSTTVTEGTETVLDDPETAQYTHILTVTGRLGGLYTCTVSNNKPSSASASITVTGNTLFTPNSSHLAGPSIYHLPFCPFYHFPSSLSSSSTKFYLRYRSVGDRGRVEEDILQHIRVGWRGGDMCQC